MRILLTVSFTIVITAFSYCSKSRSVSGKPEDLPGKWRFVEHYSDNGNGRGTWQSASQMPPQYVEFRSDGSMVVDPNVAMPPADRYEIVSNTTMKLSIPGNTYQLNASFSFEGNRLTLQFLHCIEGCGIRLVRVK